MPTHDHAQEHVPARTPYLSLPPGPSEVEVGELAVEVLNWANRLSFEDLLLLDTYAVTLPRTDDDTGRTRVRREMSAEHLTTAKEVQDRVSVAGRLKHGTAAAAVLGGEARFGIALATCVKDALLAIYAQVDANVSSAANLSENYGRLRRLHTATRFCSSADRAALEALLLAGVVDGLDPERIIEVVKATSLT